MVSRPRSLWSPSGLLLFSISFFVLTSIEAICQTNTLVVNPSSIAFGNIAVGSTARRNETVTNGFSSRLVLREITFSGSNFSKVLYLPLSLTAGQSATFPVSFTPTSAGNFSVTMTVKYRRPYNRHWVYGSSSVALQGTGTTAGSSLTVSPASINFGNVAVGSQQVLPLTLTNASGQTTSIQVSQVGASGTGFSATGISPPVTLAVGQSVTVNVNFKPTAAGTDSGAVAITSNAINPSVSVPLSGSGTSTGQLAMSPSSLNFGSVTVGKSATLNGSLTASSASVTVSSASWNGTGFSLSGLSFPLVVGAGQTLPYSVTFTPQSAGAVTGSLAFASNASNGSVNGQLSGTGVAVQQHSVALNWSPSSGSVQGYYVYRGAQSGGPYGKISPLDRDNCVHRRVSFLWADLLLCCHCLGNQFRRERLFERDRCERSVILTDSGLSNCDIEEQEQKGAVGA